VGKSVDRAFLAADIYPKWKRRVAAATESVRIYSPYLDRLAVDLLGNAALGAEGVAVVTDLSPESGAFDYRGQLLAIRRLISRGMEVRSLPRLHAKVLLVDGRQVTLGSQNFTGYGRKSRETSLAAGADLSASALVRTLNEWFDEAVSVDGDLVDRLLERLEQPMARAREAIQDLIDSFGDIELGHRREVARRRFEEHLAQARLRSTAEGLRAAASKSRFSTGQEIVWAQLDWVESGDYRSLRAEHRDLDLTNWRSPDASNVHLEHLKFYPALLGPDARVAFVRVAQSRITYVWRGVRWGATRKIGDRNLYIRTSFPDGQEDGANLEVWFSWEHGSRNGFALRMQFAGEAPLPVAEGRIMGNPYRPDILRDAVMDAYDDHESWESALRGIFSPVLNPSGFRHNKNADSFFPFGWLGIELTTFLEQPVLLIRPANEVLRFYQQLSCESLVRE
jgi:PLD-like domain